MLNLKYIYQFNQKSCRYNFIVYMQPCTKIFMKETNLMSLECKVKENGTLFSLPYHILEKCSYLNI